MQLILERTRPARLALIAGLILLLAACGSTTPPVEDGTPGGDDTPPAADEAAPQVFISSGTHSTTAAYELRGFAVDNIGIAAASYELNGTAGDDLSVAEAGSFSAELVLVPGSNDIRVSVSDEAGNEASAVTTVTYVPQIGGVSASAMVVQAGAPLTLHGSNFGPEPGTVMIGGAEAQVLDWADDAITVTVPAAGVGGWADVEISAGSTFVLEDLFVGIELTDPDLSGAIIGAGIEPGTAILLSGSEYTLTQLPVEDPANFFVPLSFYGAATEGSPLTRITPSDGMLLFSTGAGFGVQFQDLEIRAHAVRFANATTELIAPKPTGSRHRPAPAECAFCRPGSPGAWPGGFHREDRRGVGSERCSSGQKSTACSAGRRSGERISRAAGVRPGRSRHRQPYRGGEQHSDGRLTRPAGDR